MGNWVIHIEGTGAHHNGGKEFDADVLGREIVQLLMDKGQAVEHATITYGARESLRQFYAFTMDGKPHRANSRYLTGIEIKHLTGRDSFYQLFLETGKGDLLGDAIADTQSVDVAGKNFTVTPHATI